MFSYKAIPKVDSKALVTGKPVYTDDIAPKDCLIVKVLRSPHAHALIKKIDKSRALLVPGIEGVGFPVTNALESTFGIALLTQLTYLPSLFACLPMKTVRINALRWRDRPIRSQVLMIG